MEAALAVAAAVVLATVVAVDLADGEGDAAVVLATVAGVEMADGEGDAAAAGTLVVADIRMAIMEEEEVEAAMMVDLSTGAAVVVAAVDVADLNIRTTAMVRYFLVAADAGEAAAEGVEGSSTAATGIAAAVAVSRADSSGTAAIATCSAVGEEEVRGALRRGNGSEVAGVVGEASRAAPLLEAKEVAAMVAEAEPTAEEILNHLYLTRQGFPLSAPTFNRLDGSRVRESYLCRLIW